MPGTACILTPELLDSPCTQHKHTSADLLDSVPTPYGVTWTNEGESVACTGYVYATALAALQAGIRGLMVGEHSDDLSRRLGTPVDGMNNADNPQHFIYALVDTEDDTLVMARLRTTPLVDALAPFRALSAVPDAMPAA